jgi:hypothetical protein
MTIQNGLAFHQFRELLDIGIFHKSVFDFCKGSKKQGKQMNILEKIM